MGTKKYILVSSGGARVWIQGLESIIRSACIAEPRPALERSPTSVLFSGQSIKVAFIFLSFFMSSLKPKVETREEKRKMKQHNG